MTNLQIQATEYQLHLGGRYKGYKEHGIALSFSS